MISACIGIFAIGFVVAIYFVAYFIAQACINENSHSAEVLDELDRVYQEPDKKVKSIETPPTKVKSFQMELVETEPIQQCVIQAFKGVSEE